MTDAPLPAAAEARAMRLVAFMWVAYFLNYCDRQVVFALFPVFETELGFNDTQKGLIGSLFLWVYGIGCPIAGQLGDKFSKRLLVVLSLAVWSLVTVATGFSTTAFMLLALRAAMGVSEALYMPAAVALTAAAFDATRRSRALALLTTAQIFGTVAGSWFGGWMGDQGLWRTTFFVLGAVGLVYAVPYAMFLRNVGEAQPTPTQTTRKGLSVATLARVPTFVLLCVVFPAFVFGLWLLYGWLPDFLRTKFSLSLGDAALNATIYLQGATLVGVLAGGFTADRLYRRTKAARMWLLATSLLCCAPGLYALGYCETLMATRVAAVAFGLASGLFMGNIFPAAYDVVPAETRASAVGVLNLFGAVISGFGTLFGGLAKQSIGIDTLFAITAGLYVVAGVAVIVGIGTWFERDHARVQSE